jgi:hypothetical protein
MNMPRFAAEASLYKTSGQYRTGRYVTHPSARIASPIYPALRAGDGEVINVHSCLPGYALWESGDQWGCTLVEPPTGGGDDGVPTGGYDGPGGGGGGGGEDSSARKGCKPPQKRVVNTHRNSGNCNDCNSICKDNHPIPACLPNEPATHCQIRQNAAKADQQKCKDDNCWFYCDTFMCKE